MSGDLLVLGAVAALAAAGVVRRRGSQAWTVRDPYSVGGITFDPVRGMGAIGFSANIDYRGFVVWMRPSEFLALNPTIESDRPGATIQPGKRGDPARMLPVLQQSQPIGPPWLEVLYEEGPDEPVTFKVWTHEGRHRARAVQTFAGDDVLMPVHVTERKGWYFAADFTPAMLADATIKPDRRAGESGRAFQIKRFTLSGQTYGGNGSANVVTGAGYHRTAVSATGASAPLRHLIKYHGELVKGRVLDFGTGRGRDCKALGKRRGVTVSCYDPHHPDAKIRKLPAGTFDLVIANYVVNVLPKAQRRQAVKQMASKVKRGGVLVLAARGCGDRQGVASARHWTVESDGHAQFADDGELSRFQRFYASGALEGEARDILGRSFSPLQITSMPSGTELVAFTRSR